MDIQLQKSNSIKKKNNPTLQHVLCGLLINIKLEGKLKRI